MWASNEEIFSILPGGGTKLTNVLGISLCKMSKVLWMFVTNAETDASSRSLLSGLWPEHECEQTSLPPIIIVTIFQSRVRFTFGSCLISVMSLLAWAGRSPDVAPVSATLKTSSFCIFGIRVLRVEYPYTLGLKFFNIFGRVTYSFQFPRPPESSFNSMMTKYCCRTKRKRIPYLPTTPLLCTQPQPAGHF